MVQWFFSSKQGSLLCMKSTVSWQIVYIAFQILGQRWGEGIKSSFWETAFYSWQDSLHFPPCLCLGIAFWLHRWNWGLRVVTSSELGQPTSGRSIPGSHNRPPQPTLRAITGSPPRNSNSSDRNNHKNFMSYLCLLPLYITPVTRVTLWIPFWKGRFFGTPCWVKNYLIAANQG